MGPGDHSPAGGDVERHRRVELRVPGSERYLEMIRSVVGRTARLFGFSYDGVEDLALAVHEAAVLVLMTEPDGLTLSMVDEGLGRLLATEVRSEASQTGPWPPADLDHDIRWQVLSALCRDVRFLDDDGVGIGLRQPLR